MSKLILATASRVAKAADKRGTIPVLTHMRLTIRDSVATMLATDMDIAVTETVAWAAPDCDGLIPAETLVRLLKAGATGPITQAPSTQVTRTVRGKPVTEYDSGVWSFAGSSIPSLPIADYPPVPAATPHLATWQMDAATLRDMLTRVAVCMSTEDTRYYLCGVYLHVASGELRAVATDGHRLGLVAMPAPAGCDKVSAIVPDSTVKTLLALLPKAGACTVSVSPTRISVACGTTTIVSKLIDGTFPDYPRVVPKRTKKEVTFRNADLAIAIKAVIATASDKAPTIATVFDSLGACRVECRTDGVASAARDVECSGTIADLTIGANSRYWLQLLGQLGDTVTLNVTDASTPMLISDEAVTFVLMPVRF